MARALTFRDQAKNYQRQADALNRLAKSYDQAAKAMPHGSQATTAELIAAVAADDLAIRTLFQSDGAQAQADAANAAADLAGEPV